MIDEKEMRPRGKPARPRNTQGILLAMIGIGLILVAVAVILAIPQAQAEVQKAQLQQSNTMVVPAQVNYPAPAVKITDLDNKPVALSDYRGQVVLYNAWATWCPPCKEEMPTLEAYYEQHRQEGFVVVAIEDGEPSAEVAAFVKKYGLTFPVWPDPTWVATTSFKTDVLPSSFVIDRGGIVRLAWTGPITREALEKYVTPLINGQ
jgi:peroxiredoxin